MQFKEIKKLQENEKWYGWFFGIIISIINKVDISNKYGNIKSVKHNNKRQNNG